MDARVTMNSFTEPTWDYSESASLEASPLEDQNTMFVDIEGAILQLARYEFGSAGNITNPRLRKLVWSDAPASTKVRIEMYFEEPPTTEIPQILVRPEQIKSLPQTDLKRFGLVIRVSGTSSQSYWEFLQGGCTIICRTAHPLLSRALAEEIFRWMMIMSPYIRKDFDLASFRVLGAAGPDVVKSLDKTDAAVQITWIKHMNWNLAEENVY